MVKGEQDLREWREKTNLGGAGANGAAEEDKVGYSKAEDHFITVTGGIATIRRCNICGHLERVEKGRPNVGRGYGMREGNKARGRMIQHIKDCHPEVMD